MINGSPFYALLMLLAGLGIPVMAALNGLLSAKLNSPTQAVFILFAVGFSIASTVLLSTEGLPRTWFTSTTPWYLYCGGLLVIFYVLGITWVAPRFGVSNAISFVLLGQLLSMTTIDHFGVFGVTQYSITSQRSLGLILMTAGVLLVVNHSPNQ